MPACRTSVSMSMAECARWMRWLGAATPCWPNRLCMKGAASPGVKLSTQSWSVSSAMDLAVAAGWPVRATTVIS